MMLDLSTLSPDNVEPLREVVRKTRDDQRNSCFTVHWKGDYHCELFIGKQPSILDPENSGVYNFIHNLVLVKNFGNKANNKVKHRGGLPGTIFHEWCHRMQFWCSDEWIRGWGYEGNHLQQDELYDKWKHEFKVFYLASSAVEMSAEAFRALKGWRSTEPWEDNQEFLADWRDFFMNDPIFSLLF